MTMACFPSRSRVDRLAVRLLCAVCSPGLLIYGTVVNLSYGGLGIEFENSEHDVKPDTNWVVNVEGLGDFEAAVRWSRGERIGVRFTNELDARRLVQNYLDDNGLSLA